MLDSPSRQGPWIEESVYGNVDKVSDDQNFCESGRVVRHVTTRGESPNAASPPGSDWRRGLQKESQLRACNSAEKMTKPIPWNTGTEGSSYLSPTWFRAFYQAGTGDDEGEHASVPEEDDLVWSAVGGPETATGWIIFSHFLRPTLWSPAPPRWTPRPLSHYDWTPRLWKLSTRTVPRLSPCLRTFWRHTFFVRLHRRGRDLFNPTLPNRHRFQRENI